MKQSWSKLTPEEQKRLQGMISATGMDAVARALRSSAVTLDSLAHGGTVRASVATRIREKLGEIIVPTEISP